MAKPEDARPTVENRWWVDTGKTMEPAKVVPKGERPPVGSRFFDIGYEFDQERAKHRLTDLEFEVLDEGKPAPNEWRLIRMVPERVGAEWPDRTHQAPPSLPPAHAA